MVALDGAIVEDENFPNLLLDMAVLWSLNVRIVLVHGAAAQIQALAAKTAVEPSDLEGSGVTDHQTLELALTAANRLTHELLEGLSTADLRAASGNVVIAHPLGIIRGVDHLFTGRVERIDVEFIQKLIAGGIVPVIPPLGMDGEGHSYRLNSDSVALEIAKALGAVKLIYVTTAEGLTVNGSIARQVAVAELAKAILDGTVAPAQVSKARHAVAACHAGVPRVHVISGRVDEGLLSEVFSNEGIGTLVYANDYRQIRRARKPDIRSLQQLIRASVESEELLPRTRAAIEKQLDDYYIFEVDNNPVACVALHTYPDTQQGELACLCVRAGHDNQGVGRKMVQFVEDRARESGLTSLLAMSTQTFNFFQSKAGFTAGNPDDLPPARRKRYDESGRRSKVLVKSLLSETPASKSRT